MADVFSFLLVLAVAVAGGFIGNKLKLPAGGMLGAMVAVVALNIIFAQAALPSGLQVVLQIASGIMIGSRVTKSDALGLRKLALPAFVMVICMLVINIAIGTVMYRFSKLDIATSLFASAPGGMMDMAIVSAELGANPAYVVLLQLSRLMFIFMCMIPFYRKITSKMKLNPGFTTYVSSISEIGDKQQDIKSGFLLKQIFITILCGGTSGLALWWLGIPAGAIIGAMLGTAICNITTSKAYFPPSCRLPLQMVAGAFVGMRMDRESIFAMRGLIVPMLILFVGVITITFATAFVMHKLTRLNMATCLLASTPGGLTEMAILSDNLGLDTPKIAVLQVSRLMSVIIFFPTMLYFTLRILS